MPQLIRNSVWMINEDFHGIESGIYRVLDFDVPERKIILFRVFDGGEIERPFIGDFDQFIRGVENKIITEGKFDTPIIMTLAEHELKEAWKNKRDNKFNLIEPIILNNALLWALASKKRVPYLKMYAESIGRPVNSVYRMLRDYWKYGQTKNAFLPFYVNSGGHGIPKADNGVKRGKPKKQPRYAFKRRTGVNVTEKDKTEIRQSVKKYVIGQKIDVISTVYTNYLNDNHKFEVELARNEKRAPNVPNLSQFRYWAFKTGDLVEDSKDIKGDVKWDMENRGLLGSVKDEAIAPGDRFEIDATVADVFIVSDYNRRVVLGRPVIYVVADTASRMVVGMYVDIERASWKAAKQALFNAFSSKVEFCSRYGFSITDEDWPCHHLPRSLTCDKGEMIGAKPEMHLTPMGICLGFASTGRADWKAVVERRFGIANDESLHQLDGTTKGKPKKRMDPDPKEDAIYTLNEVIEILIDGFIVFNNTRFLEDLVVPELVAEDLECTPLNYWNNFVNNHRNSLSVVDEEKARAELLPACKARITGHGIEVDNVYYTCKLAEDEMWFSRARIEGEWSVDARVDDSTSNVVYVRKDNKSNLTLCSMLPRDELTYANRHKADIVWLSEWITDKKETGSDLYGKVQHANQIKRVRNKAHAERKKAHGNFKNAPNKITNIKAARKSELERRSQDDILRKNVSDNNGSKNITGKKIPSKWSLIESVLDEC